jgi:hypothetical protein
MRPGRHRKAISASTLVGAKVAQSIHAFIKIHTKLYMHLNPMQELRRLHLVGIVQRTHVFWAASCKLGMGRFYAYTSEECPLKQNS